MKLEETTVPEVLYRRVKIINCKTDFGLGPGIIYEEEVHVKTEDPTMFAYWLRQTEEEIVKTVIEVTLSER